MTTDGSDFADFLTALQRERVRTEYIATMAYLGFASLPQACGKALAASDAGYVSTALTAPVSDPPGGPLQDPP